MSDQPQGNGAPNAPQGTGAPEALTEDRVAEIVNKAISSRYKSQDAKVEKMLGDFAGKLEGLFKSKTEEQPTEQPGGKPPAIEESPQFKGLQKQLAEMAKRVEAAEQAKAMERTKSRDTALRQRLTEALGSAGIDAGRVKHALGFLVDAEKRARYAGDDSDDVVFKDINGDEVDLATGLKSWLASDDAKIYLPPRGTTGSGDRPTTQNGRGNAPPDPNAQAREVLSSWLTGPR